jgi:hypothetical protein
MGSINVSLLLDYSLIGKQKRLEFGVYCSIHTSYLEAEGYIFSYNRLGVEEADVKIFLIFASGRFGAESLSTLLRNLGSYSKMLLSTQ